MEPTDVSFDTPIGTIAAKIWGPEDGRPILAMHGWQDNCGTFDTLIPLLSGNLRIVAFDFLGHGLSSHKGKGEMYRIIDHCCEVQYITKLLNWKKYSILAHSMGACVGLLYASLYPDEILQFVSLDLVLPPLGNPSQLHSLTRKLLDMRMDLEGKLNQKPPMYTEEIATHRLIQSSAGSVNSKSATILMKRGAKLIDEEHLVFTRDLRLRTTFLVKMNYEEFKSYIVHLNKELLVIKALSSHIQVLPEIMSEMKDLYSNGCSYFQYVEVPGTHHVHLNNPEIVVDKISSFLARYSGNESKL